MIDARPTAEGSATAGGAATADDVALWVRVRRRLVQALPLPVEPRERKIFYVASVVVAIYIVAIGILRWASIVLPYSADGDQPQAVWQYWRYHLDGAMPPGDLMTDYAFVMHAPPVWWLLMATLSTIFKPLVAAKILNVIAYFGTAFVIWLVVSLRSNAFIGLCASVLLVRTIDFTGVICGGYARSFGPMLALAFLGAFMMRKHALALVILVLQSAFYPSVVIPCGIAYGLYCVVAGPTMRDRIRRCAGMLCAGVLIIAFGRYQDLKAPDWWGPVVTLEEALEMPAWKRGGRINEAPLRPIEQEVPNHATRPFRVSGPVLFQPLTDVMTAWHHAPLYALTFVAMIACAVLWIVRRRRGEDLVDAFPWQIPLLYAATFAAYLLARALAFKLYLPYRPLQHVWPYMLHAGVPLLAWCLVRNLLPRRHTIIACAAVIVPVFAVVGNGFGVGKGGYGDHSHHAPIYKFVSTLPVHSLFAGEIQFVDKIPLFSGRRSYVMKNLAHPFRAGYYKETERRMREMYEALYATHLDDVVAFARKEKIDYLVYNRSLFKQADSRLYNPVKRDIQRVFNTNKDVGFVLSSPPPAAIVFQSRGTVVLSTAKLAEAAAASPAATPPPEPSHIDDHNPHGADIEGEP